MELLTRVRYDEEASRYNRLQGRLAWLYFSMAIIVLALAADRVLQGNVERLWLVLGVMLVLVAQGWRARRKRAPRYPHA